mmetsp:Transcript_13804/g.41713  ORF Transcript_13804/g.41713 Transcript_13804/m.41713 type:complete len:216 (-) Transcript_13804:1565-2212(-)
MWPKCWHGGNYQLEVKPQATSWRKCRGGHRCSEARKDCQRGLATRLCRPHRHLSRMIGAVVSLGPGEWRRFYGGKFRGRGCCRSVGAGGGARSGAVARPQPAQGHLPTHHCIHRLPSRWQPFRAPAPPASACPGWGAAQGDACAAAAAAEPAGGADATWLPQPQPPRPPPRLPGPPCPAAAPPPPAAPRLPLLRPPLPVPAPAPEGDAPGEGAPP